MKKFMMIALVVALSGAVVTPTFAAKKSSAKKSSASDVVTHEELAKLLVNVLGLAKNLPANPTSQELFSALSVNNIAPDGGWEVGQSVTRAALARVVVQALGEADEVKNPDDPKSWIDYLASIGVPIDTVGQAADSLKPLLNPVATDVEFQSTTDPLEKPEETSGRRPDGSSFGTDKVNPLPTILVDFDDVVQVIQTVSNTRPPRRPVTPN